MTQTKILNLAEKVYQAHQKKEKVPSIRIKRFRKAVAEAESFFELFLLEELLSNLLELHPELAGTLNPLMANLKSKLSAVHNLP